MEKNQDVLKVEGEEKWNVKISVGVRLREYRQRMKLNLSQVEQMTEIPASYIHRLEAGTKQGSMRVINVLAEAYHVTSEEILGERDIEVIQERMNLLEDKSYPLDDKTYSISEYESWIGRWEMIYGEPHNIEQPDTLHQRTVSRLSIALGSHLNSHLGSLSGKEHKEIFTAPFEVQLKGDTTLKDSIVQPDVIVVDSNLGLRARRLKKAPALVVEVLSPATVIRDQKIKLELYKKSGVQEYWIVDPMTRTVQVYADLASEEPYLIEPSQEGVLQSAYLLDFQYPLNCLFE